MDTNNNLVKAKKGVGGEGWRWAKVRGNGDSWNYVTKIFFNNKKNTKIKAAYTLVVFAVTNA